MSRMLEISNNSTGIFRSCQKKYYWRYIRGLTPHRKSTALTLGSIIHLAFNMYYNGFSDEEVVKYITTVSDEEIAKASPDVVESLVIMKYTLLGMWMYYPKDLAVFTKIVSEMEITIKFMYGVRLILKVDGLVTADGKIWIRELKTSGLSYGQFERKCEVSPQASLYTYALRRQGFDVQGILFDYIKKPLLRKSVKEDKDQFGYRIMMDYKSRPDFYFQRHLSYRSEEALEVFAQDLMSVTRDILLRCRDGRWHRNMDTCWLFNSSCPYLPICHQKVPDALTTELFFKQEPINPMKGGKPCQMSKN